MVTVAVTRDVAATIASCELTHVERVPIDVARARAQHRRYEECLAELGCELRRIPADDRYPDSVFIEDTAIVLDGVAILTRPGAISRRGEVDAVAVILADYRPLRRIEAPATLDGGDVLRVGRRLYVGRSSRTNGEGIRQLRSLAAGYEVVDVPLRAALHLKTAVTAVSPSALLINRQWIDVGPFPDYELIDVDPAEPFAANALLVNGTILYPAEFSRTRARLEARALRVMTVEASELAKAEGGVTCSSIVVDTA